MTHLLAHILSLVPVKKIKSSTGGEDLRRNGDKEDNTGKIWGKTTGNMEENYGKIWGKTTGNMGENYLEIRRYTKIAPKLKQV